MSDQVPHQDVDMLAAASHDLHYLAELERDRNKPASLRALTFNGAEGLFTQLDDAGPAAVSYGIYNPVAARLYVGLAGGPARLGAFPVPRETALILPVSVNGHIEIGIDEGELGANTATIWVMRFATVQSFFMRDL